MRNTKSKVRCVKTSFGKCGDGVCRTYSPIQQAYAEELEKDGEVKEFRCNVPLTDLTLNDGKYSTDFMITKIDGDMLESFFRLFSICSILVFVGYVVSLPYITRTMSLAVKLIVSSFVV